MNIVQNKKRRNKIKVPVKQYSCLYKCLYNYFLEDSSVLDHLPCHRQCMGSNFGSMKTEQLILNELMRLSFSPSMTEDVNTFKLRRCFSYFNQKFGISKLQMQKASCHLSSFGLVSRSFREVISIEDIASKELDLTLHINAAQDFLKKQKVS
jgi:hypothetical protein